MQLLSGQSSKTLSAAALWKTFRPTEKCPQARIDRKEMQYLYADGDLFYFMDTENYEQIGLNADKGGRCAQVCQGK